MKATRTCSVADCGRPHKGHGLCFMHLNRIKKHGSLNLPPAPSLADRFWAGVSRGSEDECWEWRGHMHPQGYGSLYVESGRPASRAHRVAYELLVGPIPPGLVIDHQCRNRACVNPAHLLPCTQSLNMQNRHGAQSNSASGIRGVTWDRSRQKWLVSVRVNGKTHNGGRYSSLAEADRAASELRRVLHPNSLLDQREHSHA